jgi:hypothetical protein
VSGESRRHGALSQRALPEPQAWAFWPPAAWARVASRLQACGAWSGSSRRPKIVERRSGKDGKCDAVMHKVRKLPVVGVRGLVVGRKWSVGTRTHTTTSTLHILLNTQSTIAIATSAPQRQNKSSTRPVGMRGAGPRSACLPASINHGSYVQTSAWGWSDRRQSPSMRLHLAPYL